MVLMDAITLDQITVLLAVEEQGSFSGAARALGRAQSAVTYAIQKLEDQLGTALFDRSGYRPTLTEAGRALLPRAQRIAEEMGAFRAQARGMAVGLESELTLVADAMFPMPVLLAALKAFGAQYPTVPVRVYVETLGSAASMVLEGRCALGLLVDFGSESPLLHRVPLLAADLVPVAAASHSLAANGGLVTLERLREEVQLVLTDRSGLTQGRDHDVLSPRVWRLGDLGARHAMLLAGFGWGKMPQHMVAEDLAHRRLAALRAPELEREGRVRLSMFAATLADRIPGPAARWLIDHFVAATVALRNQDTVALRNRDIAPAGVVSLPRIGLTAGAPRRPAPSR